jgi:hypothetical protein
LWVIERFTGGLLIALSGSIWFGVIGRLYVCEQEKSQTPLTLSDPRRKMAKSTDWRLLILVGSVAAVLFVSHVLALDQARSWDQYVGTAVFGVCAVSIGYTMYLKWTLRG